MAILGPIGSLPSAILRDPSYSCGEYCERQSSASSLPLKQPQLLEELFKGQETRVDKDVTPQTNISSSSPDVAVLSPTLSYAKDFKQF